MIQWRAILFPGPTTILVSRPSLFITQMRSVSKCYPTTSNTVTCNHFKGSWTSINLSNIIKGILIAWCIAIQISKMESLTILPISRGDYPLSKSNPWKLPKLKQKQIRKILSVPKEFKMKPWLRKEVSRYRNLIAIVSISSLLVLIKWIVRNPNSKLPPRMIIKRSSKIKSLSCWERRSNCFSISFSPSKNKSSYNKPKMNTWGT